GRPRPDRRTRVVNGSEGIWTRSSSMAGPRVVETLERLYATSGILAAGASNVPIGWSERVASSRPGVFCGGETQSAVLLSAQTPASWAQRAAEGGDGGRSRRASLAQAHPGTGRHLRRVPTANRPESLRVVPERPRGNRALCQSPARPGLVRELREV